MSRTVFIQHEEFEQAILQAAEHFRGRGLRPAVIEKDYYVTEALFWWARISSPFVTAFRFRQLRRKMGVPKP